MSAATQMDMSGRQVLGRYRIVRRLARGGMGVVYLGRVEGAAGFSKAVVIKRIVPDAEDLQESTARFIREAQILSNLQHPGIVGVLDFGEEHEGYSMVLEYVHGYDLGRWLKYNQIKRRRIDWEQAVYVMLKVLDALAYAHDFVRPDGTPAEVLHRDISPGNILLDLEGRARLLDFGIARMAEGDAGQYKTQEGVLKGKVAYLAPELFSSSPPSRSSDVYACAVVLYQMLAGRNPFVAESEGKVMWRVVMEAPSPLSALRDDLPLELESVLMTSLRKDPEERYARAEDFARDLRRMLLHDDQDIMLGLREQLRTDFNGDLPELLRLEPLSQRDRAWRNSQDRSVLDRTQLRTSAVPPATGLNTASSPQALVHPATEAPSAGPMLTAVSSAPASGSSAAAGAAGAADGHGYAESPVPSPQPSSTLPPWRQLLVGAAVALGLGGALAYLSQQTVAPTTSRFIVVESPSVSKPEPREEPREPRKPDAVVPSRAPSGTAPSVQAPRPSKRPDARDPKAIARKFASRNGALQDCFERFATQLEGKPRISVQFDVKATGKVTSAGLEPSSLNGTPLGQCLLRVARGTSFGSLGKPVRFSIPIHARAVAR